MGTHESDAATERMDELVGHPTCSPYGNPIPAASDDDWAAIWLRDDAVNSVRPTRACRQSRRLSRSSDAGASCPAPGLCR